MTTSHLFLFFSQIPRVEEMLHSHCHFATHYMEEVEKWSGRDYFNRYGAIWERFMLQLLHPVPT